MKKSILLAALVIGIGSVGVAGVGAAECYSDGVRVGVVQKFSKKGFITKSWEGEMVQAGIRSRGMPQGPSGGGITDIWRFSVTDAIVAKQLDDAVFDGGEVAVRYCQVPPLSRMGVTDTSYVVTSVRRR